MSFEAKPTIEDDEPAPVGGVSSSAPAGADDDKPPKGAPAQEWIKYAKRLGVKLEPGVNGFMGVTQKSATSRSGPHTHSAATGGNGGDRAVD